MRKRNLLAALLAAILCCGLCCTTAFAQTNEPEAAAASAEAAPAEELVTKGETEEPEELPPLIPEGNLTLVDDISTESGSSLSPWSPGITTISISSSTAMTRAIRPFIS